jgi:carotenoid cleavage dioxygenase-like enzyme
VAQTAEAPPFFAFHHTNAYEVPDGRVVLDTIAWDTLDFGTNLDTLSPSYYQ